MEHNYTCPICESHEGFLLYADYAASGLWCKKCGISFSNPEKDFPNLDKRLVDLIFVWIGYWEAYADELSKYNYEFLHNIYCTSGKYIAEIVSEFYPCVFEDR